MVLLNVNFFCMIVGIIGVIVMGLLLLISVVDFMKDGLKGFVLMLFDEISVLECLGFGDVLKVGELFDLICMIVESVYGYGIVDVFIFVILLVVIVVIVIVFIKNKLLFIKNVVE